MFKWEGHSEIDKNAMSVYEKHFPESQALGDIKTIDINRIPERLDLLTFGFPCQDLSTAGKGKGLGAARSSLFFEAMQIVRVRRPRYFIFENVMGLFSKTPARNNYEKREWFLPQSRERIYFVGHLRGEAPPEIFPIGERYNKTGNNIQCNKRKTIYFDDSFPKTTTRRGRVMDIAGTLLANYRGGVAYLSDISGDIIFRRFTPIEYERLQGFPDNWTLYGVGKKEIKDSQRYKMIGNAVSVPVVKAVISRLLASGVKIETYLDLFSGAGGFRLGIEEAIKEYKEAA